MTPERQLAVVLQRLAVTDGGIMLFHDTRAQTAAMVAPLLRALKTRNFRIVHTVPAVSAPGGAAQ
jgi:hypothetical protein